VLSISQIPGLESTKQSLIQSLIDNRVPQTQLYINADGGSGLALAMAFSQYIACSNPSITSCGNCVSCKQFMSGNYPDLVLVFPSVKSGLAKKDKSRSTDYLEDFRDLIRMNPFVTTPEWHEKIESGNKQFSIPVSDAEYIIQTIATKTISSKPRFVVIWLPEALSKEAANKLLKTLEEPGKGNYFILVSVNPEKILPTILSRCVSLRIPKLRDIDVLDFLMSRGLAEPQATAMALASNGNLGLAISSIIRGGELEEYTEFCIQWLRILYSRKIESLINWCETLSKLNRVDLIAFLTMTIHVFQKAITLSVGSSTTGLKHGTFDLTLFIPYLKTEKGPEIVELFERAIREFERNGSPKIILLDLSFNLLKYIG
jgi:DNA polymerase-3 subunit delta'